MPPRASIWHEHQTDRVRIKQLHCKATLGDGMCHGEEHQWPLLRLAFLVEDGSGSSYRGLW
eukprot:11639328-Prorocentrum_lima.AAC.1